MVMGVYWVGGWIVVDILLVIGSFIWLRRTRGAERLLSDGHVVLAIWATALIVEYSALKLLGNRVDARLALVHVVVAAAVLLVGRLRRELKAAVPFAVWFTVEAIADVSGSHPLALPLWAWSPVAFGGALYLWQVCRHREVAHVRPGV
jgi:hypothetical protein